MPAPALTTLAPHSRRTARPAWRRAAAAIGAAALVVGLASCGTDDDGAAVPEEGGTTETVTIGVVGAAQDYWRIFEERAADEGIDVDLVDFTEYSQPNPALSQGQLDVNQFQHILYLAQYNVEAGEDLVPIGATAVYPLGLYSERHTSVDDIPEGGEIAVPNDPTNLARALLVLQDAGLVALRDGGSAFVTEADVLAEESRVSVTPVDAQQTALALGSVDASIINNDFLLDAGIDADSALYQDDAGSDAARPYINIWATRAEDADNPTYLRLVEIFKDEEIQQALVENSGGTAVLADQSAEELRGYLADVEADAQG
ncbi:MetQ/NlpA family ABC transporter substrate-binding protein [Cellulomonas bogoriensis]|uniref:Methionine ABC transporter substrate-binding protein n=1 Tax=Cellulomonas bogoriensis 69B4 = DSM 16987 TaxID=1386082 RepID=A0A0A0C4I2_9CELL|nr:MetQ/NlpA family ABC transporter substrate-binding protein [Cellulomonas bogoriensis]KGM14224.1 methionine ABC transporter substrate-binding protein [Cellulomonas bogoriensis 69B4 = DSM 16987]